MACNWMQEAGLASLCRISLQAASAYGRSYGRRFPYTLSAFSLRAKDGFVIPLSFAPGRFCHFPMHLGH